ncbi:MAG: DUF3482 domain-containing protein [Planctomycetia bacterium]|nr:DUF3482 domain-containing protein [Planctomycetia bacterium]
MADVIFDFEALKRNPFVVAVVGPTNVGKTTLIRTLAKDSGFGEVRDEPSVTRDATSKIVHVAGHDVVRWTDTPGFECAAEIIQQFGKRPTAAEVRQFVTGSNEEPLTCALQAIDAAHVLLYVVDVQQNPSDDDDDLFAVLRPLGKPIVPVLNFLNRPINYRQLWEERLNAAGMHAIVPFDAHERTAHEDQILFERVRALLPFSSHHEQFLKWWIPRRQDEFDRLHRDSARILVEWAVRVIQLQKARHHVDLEQADSAGQELLNELGGALDWETKAAVGFLKNSHAIPENVTLDLNLNDVSGEKTERGHRLGVRWVKHTAAGATTGLMIGTAIDVLTLGATLGIGTLLGGGLGSLVGGAAGTVLNYQFDAKNRVVTAKFSTPEIAARLARLLWLASRLHRLGKAAIGQQGDDLVTNIKLAPPDRQSEFQLVKELRILIDGVRYPKLKPWTWPLSGSRIWNGPGSATSEDSIRDRLVESIRQRLRELASLPTSSASKSC